MKRIAMRFTTLALAATIIAPWHCVQAQQAGQGPSEINLCQTISQPGSYILVNNLAGPFDANGNCLVITANFVSIDLAGFTLSGKGYQTLGTGIIGVPPSSGSLFGIAVRNGSISLFTNAVDLGAAAGSIVENLRVTGNYAGDGGANFGRGIVANGIVKDNTAVSYSYGIIAGGVVTGNVADSNVEGISAPPGSTVTGNSASFNTRLGISVSCPSNLTNNTATAVNNPQSVSILLSGDGCNNNNNVGTVQAFSSGD